MGWAGIGPAGEEAAQQEAGDYPDGVGHEVLGLEGAFAHHALEDLQGCRVGNQPEGGRQHTRSHLREDGAQGENGVPGEVQRERERFAQVGHLDARGAAWRQERGDGRKEGKDARGPRPCPPHPSPDQGLFAPRPGGIAGNEGSGSGELLAHTRGCGATEGGPRGHGAFE